MANFQEAVQSGFSRWKDFSGRASRSEYWYFSLMVFIGNVITSIVDTTILGQNEFGIVGIIFTLIVFIPGLALAVRRMHDLDRRGWWLLLHLALIIGTITLLFWKCRKGTDGPNRFGPDPLAN